MLVVYRISFLFVNVVVLITHDIVYIYMRMRMFVDNVIYDMLCTS